MTRCNKWKLLEEINMSTEYDSNLLVLDLFSDDIQPIS